MIERVVTSKCDSAVVAAFKPYVQRCSSFPRVKSHVWDLLQKNRQGDAAPGVGGLVWPRWWVGGRAGGPDIRLGWTGVAQAGLWGRGRGCSTRRG